jgi:hypothetical protein
MGTELQTPCNCMGCMLKEMRCLESTGGKIFLSRRSQRLCVDKGALRGKLHRYNKERVALMREWAAVAIQTVWRGFRVRQRFRHRLKGHRAMMVMQRVVRGFLAKNVTRRRRFRMTCAAIEMQRIYRGYRGSRKAGQFRVERTEAAEKIERVFRGMKGRRHWVDEFETRTTATLRPATLPRRRA